jgi:hypothetical protein
LTFRVPPPQCDEPGCDAILTRWRECPGTRAVIGHENFLEACARRIAYCDEHGGDDRATTEMSAHILSEH